MAVKPRTNFCCFLFLMYAVSVSVFAFSLSAPVGCIYLTNEASAGAVDGKGQVPPTTHHPARGNLQELVSGGSDRSARRLLIGSTAPICTYNECRGCKTRCSAEQVPVNANDPMNSAYRYRCVCHR